MEVVACQLKPLSLCRAPGIQLIRLLLSGPAAESLACHQRRQSMFQRKAGCGRESNDGQVDRIGGGPAI